MNAPVPVEVAVPSLAMSEAELISVLGNSIYPGAKPESMKLVIGYCKAARLDPLQKPVHIVPMDVKTGRKDSDGKDIYEKRDVIMPGVGLYRTNAARTGMYAGKSEPEFGPMKTLNYTVDVWTGSGNSRRKQEKEETIEYPEWCRVTVEKFLDGHKCLFTAKELWLENYATAGNWTEAPNKMWRKRPFAQLAKCAEAQALRMAFPDAVGSAPTAEEMEGKVIDGEVIHDQPRIEQPQTKESASAGAATGTAGEGGDRSDAGGGAEKKAEGEPFKAMLPQQKKMLEARLKNAKLSAIDIEAHFKKSLATTDATGFSFADYGAVEKWISENAKP